MSKELLLIATIFVFSASPAVAQNNQQEEFDEEASDAREFAEMLASGKKTIAKPSSDPLNLPITKTPVRKPTMDPQKPVVCDLPMPTNKLPKVTNPNQPTNKLPKVMDPNQPTNELPRVTPPNRPTNKLPRVNMPKRKAPLFVSAWLPNFQTAAAKDEIVDNAGKGLDEVNPNWYSLEGAHIVHNRSRSRQLEPILHASGIRIVPVISGFNPKTVNQLGTYAARKSVISDLEYLVEKNDFAGIEIRISDFKSHNNVNMLQLLAEMRRSMGLKNKTVALNIDDSLVLNNKAVGDDETFLTEVDFLKVRVSSIARITMPAPVTNSASMERAIKAALKFVQHDKLIVEVSMHGRIYTNGRCDVITARRAANEMSRSQSMAAYDSKTSTLRCATANGTMYFEDSRSIAGKLKIANKYAIKGIAISKLGYGDSTMWAEVNAAKK